MDTTPDSPADLHADDGVPVAETYNERTARLLRERSRLDARLNEDWLRIHGPDAPVEPPDPDAFEVRVNPIVHPTLLPASLEWEGEESRNQAAQAVIDAPARTEPRKLEAMRLIDFHFARGMVLPEIVLDAHACATDITDALEVRLRWEALQHGEDVDFSDRYERSVRSFDTGLEWPSRQAAIEESHRLAQPQSRAMRSADRVQVYGLLRWFTQQGEAPPDPLRRAAAQALGLIDKDPRKGGVWRREVVKAIHHGLGEPELFLAAAEVEAQARVQRRARGVRQYTQALTAETIANSVGADPRKIERWMARPDWESVLMSRTIWLWLNKRHKGIQAEARVVAEADSRNIDEQEMVAVVSRAVMVHPDVARQWRQQNGWKRAVYIQVGSLIDSRWMRERTQNTDL
jgi:hypothetical protein